MLAVKQSIAINGKIQKLVVPMYDRNPNVTFLGLPLEKKVNNDKITIKNLPLSASNDMIEKMLKENNVKLLSPIRYGNIRDENGQLTDYKSGDRYVYVEPFDQPLSRQQAIGSFQCLVLHHGKTMSTCKSCNREGHKIGDDNCPAKPQDNILSFRGYTHPLSNHYPCKITVNGKTFKSLEHAFFHRMATEMGKTDLAEQIKQAAHAGTAKKMSKNIASDEERWEWELNNKQVMGHLLQAKLQQCPEFKQCLIESSGALIAEATQSKIWGTGLSPYITEHTSPEYWPGRNLLGAMLTEMSQHVTQQVAEQASEHPSDQPMEDASGSGEVSDHDDPQEAQSTQLSPSINQSEPAHQANVADSQPVNESTSQPSNKSANQPVSHSINQSIDQSGSKSDNQMNSQSTNQPGSQSVVQVVSQSTNQTAIQSTNESPSSGCTGQFTGESAKACSTKVSTGEPTGRSTAGPPVHRSRQRQRSPAALRVSRSFSTPRRTKGTDSAQDIGSYFDRTKRKEFASSPDEKDSGQGKMMKSDSADTVGS